MKHGLANFNSVNFTKQDILILYLRLAKYFVCVMCRSLLRCTLRAVKPLNPVNNHVVLFQLLFRITEFVQWKLSSCMRNDGQTNRQTDMPRLINVFRKFSNAPKNTSKECFVFMCFLGVPVTSHVLSRLRSSCQENAVTVLHV
jgi:hypothetical protein